MGAVRGVVSGVLALTMLETVVSDKRPAAGRVGGLLRDLGGLSRHLLSADVPLIPDRRRSSSSSTAGGVGTTWLPPDQLDPTVPRLAPAPPVNPPPRVAPPPTTPRPAPGPLPVPYSPN